MKNMISLFYCPKCGKEEQNCDRSTMDIIFTCVNTRDGYGKFIEHYECPNCGNVLAGYIKYLAPELIDYYKDIITQYNENGVYFDPEMLKFATKNLQKTKRKNDKI